MFISIIRGRFPLNAVKTPLNCRRDYIYRLPVCSSRKLELGLGKVYAIVPAADHFRRKLAMFRSRRIAQTARTRTRQRRSRYGSFTFGFVVASLGFPPIDTGTSFMFVDAQ